ncbi:hypothetical protein NC651_011926 [Populus alba x Populus x berolinensis]|nr:hypothetical protein NC651_011925 [Populus alba x Populus x berolinensis]KAJ6928069.1 hypothetical protein NC651_011926 [Populus alba x Populus x berolinensis]
MSYWFSSIPIVAGNMRDKCVWREAENGGYTVKTAYQVALSMSRMRIDSLACRSLLLKQTGTYGSTGILSGELVVMLSTRKGTGEAFQASNSRESCMTVIDEGIIADF